MSRPSLSNSDTLVVPGLLALDIDRASAERQYVRIVGRSDHRAGKRLPHIDGARLVDDDSDFLAAAPSVTKRSPEFRVSCASPGAMQNRPIHRARKAPDVTLLIGISDRAIPLT